MLRAFTVGLLCLIVCTAADRLPPATTASYDGTWWGTFKSSNFDGPSGVEAYVTGQYSGRVLWDAENKRARIDVVGTVNVTSSNRGAPRVCNATAVRTTTVLRDGSSYVVLPGGKCVRSNSAWSTTWPGLDSSSLQLTDIDQCYPNGSCAPDKPNLTFNASALPCTLRLVPTAEQGSCNSWGIRTTGASGAYFNDLMLIADGDRAGLPSSWNYNTGGSDGTGGGSVSFVGGFLAIDIPQAEDLAANGALFDVPQSCA